MVDHTRKEEKYTQEELERIVSRRLKIFINAVQAVLDGNKIFDTDIDSIYRVALSVNAGEYKHFLGLKRAALRQIEYYYRDIKCHSEDIWAGRKKYDVYYDPWKDHYNYVLKSYKDLEKKYVGSKKK